MTPSTTHLAAPVVAGVLALAVSLLPCTAQAQDASGALIELVPPGTVLADPSSPVRLTVLALDSDGSPFELVKAKVSTNAGSAGKLKADGPGRYIVELTPPDQAQDLQVVLSARTPAKAPVTRTFHLKMGTPLPTGMSFEASPARVTLGPSATSTLSLQLEPGADVAVEDLEIKAMAGSIANPTHLGGGRVTALYTAPPVNYPHLDIITVVDRRDPDRLYRQITLPLVGRADFPVVASAGSSVLLAVGEREFGPVVADAQGRAMVPLEVPPGIAEATVTTPQGSSQLDLGIPAFARSTFIVPYLGVPADPEAKIPLRLVVATDAGEPDAEVRPAISASAGAVGEPVYEGDGIYRIDFTPPVVTVPTTVQVGAALPGDGEQFRPQASFQVVPILPDRIGLDVAEPPGGGADWEVYLGAVTAAGLGLPGQALTLGAAGASVQGGVEDRTDGVYGGRVRPQDGPFEIWVDAGCTPTGNPARELLLIPTTRSLATDGWSSTILTVVALDDLGHPVPGVAVTLSQQSGDGGLPPSVTTAGCGVARVGYTAGEAAGLTVLKASAGDLEAITSILQGPGALIGDTDPGFSGTERQRALRDTWSQRFPVLRAGSMPQAAVAVAPTPEVAPEPTPAPVEPTPAEREPQPASTAPVAALEVEVQPATVAPGSTLTVKISATDAEFRGVVGETFDLLVSAGSASDIEELGQGNYRATLEVPKRQSEPLKITVSTTDGEHFQFVKVPVSEDAPVADPEPAVADAPEPAEQPAADPEQPKEREPKEPKVREPRERKAKGVTHRWLRVRGAAGLGMYDYEYIVDETPRVIIADGDPLPYEQSLVLEGADRELVPGGTASRQPMPELDLRARGWVPSFAYVGADVRYRGHYLGVDTDAFARYNEGLDLGYWDHFLTATIQGRYFHDLGDTRLWLGLAGGTVTTAVPVPAHWSPDGGPAALWFFPWGFTSFYGGVRGGVETGFGLELMAEAAIGTEKWTGVFVQEQSYELSYEVVDHLTVDLVIDMQARHIVVPLEDIEPYEPMVQVYDQRIGANLGLGLAF